MLIPSATSRDVGYRIEPAQHEPNDRIVVTWHDPALETEDAALRARQRRALEQVLWLVVDEVEDLSGVHLQGWGEPFVVINYGNFEPDAGASAGLSGPLASPTTCALRLSATEPPTSQSRLRQPRCPDR